MFLQGRVIIVWLTWLIAGICGVFILLIVICYCRLMPRHQKSFDEQYLKNYEIKENQEYTHSRDSYKVVKHAEHRIGLVVSELQSYTPEVVYKLVVHMQRYMRPVSYAGDAHCRQEQPRPPEGRHHVQYASSGMLDEIDSAANIDALKTRSLPAFLRPKPRPLSTEDDLQQLYAKVSLSKKYKNRMRSEHAAIIALSKSHSQFLHTHTHTHAHDDADAVIVYDQRTAL